MHSLPLLLPDREGRCLDGRIAIKEWVDQGEERNATGKVALTPFQIRLLSKYAYKYCLNKRPILLRWLTKIRQSGAVRAGG